jgi:hypothetical protein
LKPTSGGGTAKRMGDCAAVLASAIVAASLQVEGSYGFGSQFSADHELDNLGFNILAAVILHDMDLEPSCDSRKRIPPFYYIQNVPSLVTVFALIKSCQKVTLIHDRRVVGLFRRIRRDES